ncbi:MAG: flavin prenyltransferase UbiX [Pirellulaceae bacterium]|jgi:4-hydroxy-3-polyprenylbenzoate decarboxylase|nr:flavin prenyltransferase UbiX [Pirellulaceae bacterium]MDP7019792.1 flavin prenyltransferase UbiX [Pirellulaceae bacterium]
MNDPLAVGITGASGAVYAQRLLRLLSRAERDVHVSISSSGAAVIEQEMGLRLDLNDRPLDLFLGDDTDLTRLRYHHHSDMSAAIASGSCRLAAMAVCPCSGATLSAVASGASGNLIQRAAEVQLKERRKLVLVTRETPLSLACIDNMRRAAEYGAVVLPASPGWYHGVRDVSDLVDFIVARVLDQFDIPHELIERWGAEDHSGESQ